MKRAAAALLAGLAVAAGAAERPEETRAERLAADGVRSALQHRDCTLAVSRLNEGLAARHPSLLLMAGTMYEEGLCLKPNWDRARQLYLRAAEAGHQGGVYRLVAGLAVAGREPGTAVWWAQQASRLAMPADCRVPDWVHADPEAYVATLKAWPAGRVQACAYVAGVMGTVAGDSEYPLAMLNLGVAGTVDMLFVPAEGRMDWRTSEIEVVQLSGVTSGDTLLDRSARSVQEGLRKHLEDIGERALRRYDRPSMVDPAWRVQVQYVFRIE